MIYVIDRKHGYLFLIHFFLNCQEKEMCAIIIQCFDASLTTSHPIWYCTSRPYIYTLRKLETKKVVDDSNVKEKLGDIPIKRMLQLLSCK